MVTTQTIWVVQWERYTEMAKSQNAPMAFWIEVKKIAIPAQGQVTETEIKQLKALMLQFKLAL
ncbi:MAG: hypothetical protein HYR96_06390 [Deltaproteobacteria bacterium]|nr:hypothetical protein [Deltaproteobacteria bacterium]MBI3295854.1 hypothetical protein [Deltaproteobacteria bacterium]